jgi:hydrogenase maturation factor
MTLFSTTEGYNVVAMTDATRSAIAEALKNLAWSQRAALQALKDE